MIGGLVTGQATWDEYLAVALDQIIALAAPSANVSRRILRLLDELAVITPPAGGPHSTLVAAKSTIQMRRRTALDWNATDASAPHAMNPPADRRFASMSALPQALPLALSAAVYTPALLVLLLLLSGQEPRRLVLAYYGGATILTIGAGLIALAVLKEGGITTQSSQTASGSIYILLGLLLLALAAWAWRRRVDEPEEIREGGSAASGRLAKWSRRATTSPKWALALGLAMFLPSPLYLLAVKDIADSGDPTSSDALGVIVCAVGVMVFVEVPPRRDVHKARWRRCRTQPRNAGMNRAQR